MNAFCLLRWRLGSQCFILVATCDYRWAIQDPGGVQAVQHRCLHQLQPGPDHQALPPESPPLVWWSRPPSVCHLPHTLPEREQYYPFRLLEGGEFGEGYGIVEVDGNCSLFGQAFQLEDTSRYYASLWEREEGSILHSKVAVTFQSNEWMRVSVAVICCPIL